jgi:hypothetical protein
MASTAQGRVPVWEVSRRGWDECPFGKRHCSTQTRARLGSVTGSLGRVPVWDVGTSARWEAPQRRDECPFGKRHGIVGTSARLEAPQHRDECPFGASVQHQTSARLGSASTAQGQVHIWQASLASWDECSFRKHHCSTQTSARLGSVSARLGSATAPLGRVPVWEAL